MLELVDELVEVFVLEVVVVALAALSSTDCVSGLKRVDAALAV